MNAGVCSLNGVGYDYGEHTALADIALTIPEHSLAGVIGPDGVGKSTLLALIAGVRRPQSGEICVLDLPLTHAAARRALANRIAYMPQGLGSNLYPTLSIRENLMFFARLFSLKRAAREARIEALLAATGLAPFADRPAGKLSGGMKQKLGLCCALIHDPDLMILDEPTTGVDPLSRRQFWRLIDQLRGERPALSIIVATAYMEEAAQFDWLAMMHAGEIIARGTPDELKRSTDTDSLDDAFVAMLPAAARETGGGKDLASSQPPPADAPLAIEAERLTRRFGDFTAVDNVSFRIRRGEIFGFLGSNGCGKTTTMKMLTGLLPASEGKATLLGQQVDGRDLEVRRRIGYMSQSFSLYEELTVSQNLQLHGRIYDLAGDVLDRRIHDLLDEMDLAAVANRLSGSLPLGQRQRLSLAVAIIHRPEVLILDEPTSGVDPLARDRFWQTLLGLSRRDGVTIFISTHYLNEAERCDRISLMHAGRVLAQGRPGELVEAEGAADLEAAFIRVLEREQREAGGIAPPAIGGIEGTADRVPVFDHRRLLAYATRELRELWREPIRLTFALVGPLFLLLAMGYGVNFDVEHVSFAAHDGDRTPASRRLLEAFESSRYFSARRPIADRADMDRRLASGNLKVAADIRPDFGKHLAQGIPEEVGFRIDGAMPFHAERARAYVLGAMQVYARQLAEESGQPQQREPYTLQTRFRYNPDLDSINSIGPGMIAVLMTLIPSLLMAVAVVREKELGSIINYYATPTNRLEFLWGKQLPYVVVGIGNFIGMVIFAQVVFGLPVKGSMAALLAGGVLYALTASSLGLVISCFTRTQIAALFAAMIISMIPSVNFSGLLRPLPAMEGAGYWVGTLFPTGYMLNITVGCFTKGLGFAELWRNYVVLALFFFGLSLLSALLLRKEAG